MFSHCHMRRLRQAIEIGIRVRVIRVRAICVRLTGVRTTGVRATSVRATSVRAICVLATLAGCAASANTPPAGTQFDGVYAGKSTLIGGFGYVCGAPSYATSIAIKNGRFDTTISISPAATPVVAVQVRADGTLAGQTLYWAETDVRDKRS